MENKTVNIFDDVDKLSPFGWSYGELKEFADIWHKALDKARKTRDLDKLTKFFTDDFKYTWCIPGVDHVYLNRPTAAEGKETVLAEANKEDSLFSLKSNMLGIEDWSYPWSECLIDPNQAVIMYIWHEVTPYQKKDGTFFNTKFNGVTRIHYAGSYQMKLMEDLADRENLVATIDEVISAGFAPPELVAKQKAYKDQLAKDEEIWEAHIAGLLKKK